MSRSSMSLTSLLSMMDNNIIGLVIHYDLPGQQYRIVELTDTGVNAIPLEVNSDWEDPNHAKISIPGTAMVSIADSDLE